MIGLLYTYAHRTPAIEKRAAYAESIGVPIIWDSGAFSVYKGNATIDVDEHARWIIQRQNAGSTARYIGLDVIGNVDGTVANITRQTQAGARVEATLHYPAPARIIDRFKEHNIEWLNLGGLAWMKGDQMPRALAWIAKVQQRNQQRFKIHGLGATPPAMIGNVHMDSIDSTYWQSPAKFRTMPLFDPRIGTWRLYMIKSNRGTNTPTMWKRLYKDAGWIRRTYNITPDDLFSLKSTDLNMIAVTSHRRFQDWLRARHKRETIIYLAGASSMHERHIDMIAKDNA